MKANEREIEEFLSSNKTQFIIPVYQRNYDWSEKQCEQLLNDILMTAKNKNIDRYFIGSMVHINNGSFSLTKIKELIIIDGQQRLVTLTLIYLTLCRLAKQLGDKDLADEISETYLTNKYASKEKLKLRPTENNDKALKFLLRNDDSEEFSEFSRLIENFNYFKKRITKENYQSILEGLSKLEFVDIALDRKNDDPQKIFESLNSTGLELTQADLIRNYILMDLNMKNKKKFITIIGNT